jgi:hypothetical protein
VLDEVAKVIPTGAPRVVQLAIPTRQPATRRTDRPTEVLPQLLAWEGGALGCHGGTGRAFL